MCCFTCLSCKQSFVMGFVCMQRFKCFHFYWLWICMSYHVSEDSSKFIDDSWKKTRMRVTLDWRIKSGTLWVRQKKKWILSDFVSEREGKQVLLWKCSFDNSHKAVTYNEIRNKSLRISPYRLFSQICLHV